MEAARPLSHVIHPGVYEHSRLYEELSWFSRRVNGSRAKASSDEQHVYSSQRQCRPPPLEGAESKSSDSFALNSPIFSPDGQLFPSGWSQTISCLRARPSLTSTFTSSLTSATHLQTHQQRREDTFWTCLCLGHHTSQSAPELLKTVS